MSIRSIEVVSIPVGDQDRAKAFYADALGFSVQFDAPFDEGMRWVQLAPPGGGTSITLVTWLENMQPGAIKDLYLECDDLRGTYDTLRQHGVNFTDEPFDSPFGMFVHFQDPDGNGWVLHQNQSA